MHFEVCGGRLVPFRSVPFVDEASYTLTLGESPMIVGFCVSCPATSQPCCPPQDEPSGTSHWCGPDCKPGTDEKVRTTATSSSFDIDPAVDEARDTSSGPAAAASTSTRTQVAASGVPRDPILSSSSDAAQAAPVSATLALTPAHRRWEQGLPTVLPRLLRESFGSANVHQEPQEGGQDGGLGGRWKVHRDGTIATVAERSGAVHVEPADEALRQRIRDLWLLAQDALHTVF